MLSWCWEGWRWSGCWKACKIIPRVHTLPYSVNGRLTENKIFNPFISVRIYFLSVLHSAMSVSHSANALLVRRGPFNPEESFVHAQNLQRTSPEKGTHLIYGGYALTLFCSELMRSLSCTCPVHILWCPVDLIRSWTTTSHATGQPVVFWTVTACSADDYWQGMHRNWQITGVKRWSTGPNWWHTWQNFQLYRFWNAVTW